jgi:hypothetical protein
VQLFFLRINVTDVMLQAVDCFQVEFSQIDVYPVPIFVYDYFIVLQNAQNFYLIEFVHRLNDFPDLIQL